MFSIPSPGDVVSGIGHAMQGAEQFVSGALNGAISAVENHADQPSQPATVSNPQNPNATALLNGVVSVDTFNRFQQRVIEAFQAVRADIASLRAYGPDGESGVLYGDSNSGGGNGGGFGGGNPLMMILLLQSITGASSSSTTLTQLLPLMLIMGNGGGQGFSLATFLAMGLI